jgi:hypothetical protein
MLLFVIPQSLRDSPPLIKGALEIYALTTSNEFQNKPEIVCLQNIYFKKWLKFRAPFIKGGVSLRLTGDYIKSDLFISL